MIMSYEPNGTVEISDFRVRIGTVLDDKIVSSLNGSAIERGNERCRAENSRSRFNKLSLIEGEFSVSPRGNRLIFTPSGKLEWPNCVRALQHAMGYMFGLETVYFTEPNGDETVMEETGATWCAYSAASGLQYMGPHDYSGMYRE